MLDKETILEILKFFKKYGKPRRKKICFIYKDALFLHAYEDEIENIIVQYEYEYGGK